MPDYIPVPLYNERGEWEPWDYRVWKPMEWPTGFDTSRLPTPMYNLNERVRFKWSGVTEMTGVIRKISLSGGMVTPYEASDIQRVFLARYSEAALLYTINANGHDRWVHGNRNIIGRA